MPTIAGKRPFVAALVAACLGAAAPAVTQEPPETFGEEVVVREVSVAVTPPGSGANLPDSSAIAVKVDGVPREVTRVERIFENKRGNWRFLIYIDPALAGARSRYHAALALAQRSEDLAALGSVEILVAGAAKPLLERTDSWQRIEAALLTHALEARVRLDRGDPPKMRPSWEEFEAPLGRFVSSVADYERGTRVAILLSDGLFAVRGSDEVRRVARELAAAGWVTLPLAWTEAPSEGAADRLSEFESWRQGAEGRDASAGTRRYVIDLGRVVRRLTGATAPQTAAEPSELEPELVALQNLAGPTSGRVVRRQAELQAALGDLARRWRVWFQTRTPGGGEPLSLEVSLGDKPLAAPIWFRLPPAE